MKHSKRYSRTGTGVNLMCGDKVMFYIPSRRGNFHTTSCSECGMDVRTWGDSPEKDVVEEFDGKIPIGYGRVRYTC